MDVSEFNYDLPQELIAQTPLADRSSSRLLAIDRENGDIKHGHFTDIKKYIKPGDCLVLNDTRVIPARLIGVLEGTDKPMEFVLLKRLSGFEWETIVRPGKRAKVGARFSFGEGLLRAQVLEIKEDGNRVVRFECDGIFEEVLDKIGIMPLPPYIKEKLEDPERYQTVYSKEKGSAAAPTAGLHFTKELLQELKEYGVEIAFVTLHVGLGTFRPVKETVVEEHYMHEEYFDVSQETCDLINETRSAGGRIIAVGTTSCRVLESVADEKGHMEAKSGWTRIYIYPGYKFKIMDGLITNFHLPCSTLLMLVSAFAGRENILNAYNIAIKNRYRFFSFGDACIMINGVSDNDKD